MSISKLHILLCFLAVPGLMVANPHAASQDSWMTRAKNYFSSWFKKESAVAPRAMAGQGEKEPISKVALPAQAPAPVAKPIPSAPLTKYPATPLPWDKKGPLLTHEQWATLKNTATLSAIFGASGVMTEELKKVYEKHAIRLRNANLIGKTPESMTEDEARKFAEITEQLNFELAHAFDLDDCARGAARGVITQVPGHMATMAGSTWCKQRYGTDYVSWMAPTLCETAAKTIMAAGWNDKKYRMRTKDFVAGLGADAAMAGLGYCAVKTLPTILTTSSESDAQQGWGSWLVRGTVAIATPMIAYALRDYVRSTVIKPALKSVAKSLNYPSILGYKKPKPKIKKSRMPQQPGGQEIDGVYYSPEELVKFEHLGNAMMRQYQQQPALAG